MTRATWPIQRLHIPLWDSRFLKSQLNFGRTLGRLAEAAVARRVFEGERQKHIFSS